MLTLDHVIISVQNLDSAKASYRELGFTVLEGGQHADGITENALIVFADGTYLELLALVDGRNRDESPFKALIAESGDRYTGFALQSDDLAADLAAIRERGLSVSEVQTGSRTRPDGVELRWQMATLGDTLAPFFIADETERSLRVPMDADSTTHANGATGIAELLVKVPDVNVAIPYYSAILGTPLRLLHAARFELGSTALVIAAGGDGLPSMLTLYTATTSPMLTTIGDASFTFI